MIREASEELSLEQEIINPVVDSLLVDLSTDILTEHDYQESHRHSAQVRIMHELITTHSTVTVVG